MAFHHLPEYSLVPLLEVLLMFELPSLIFTFRKRKTKDKIDPLIKQGQASHSLWTCINDVPFFPYLDGMPVPALHLCGHWPPLPPTPAPTWLFHFILLSLQELHQSHLLKEVLPWHLSLSLSYVPLLDTPDPFCPSTFYILYCSSNIIIFLTISSVLLKRERDSNPLITVSLCTSNLICI